METNWRNDPATEKQLNYLSQFGHVSDQPLTKGEASDLLTQFAEDPERQAIRDKNQATQWEQEFEEDERNLAYRLHSECVAAKQAIEEADQEEAEDAISYFNDSQNERLYFWEDTFRPPDEMEGAGTNLQPIKLYFLQGYRFEIPSKEVIQSLLDAIDENSSTWDKDTPEYFFQTLEHNFPEHLRAQIDFEALETRRKIYLESD